jgi:hypothetical protein
MITKEQVEEAKKSLREMYLQHCKDVFGIEVGAIVICRDTSSKNNGRECRVTRIEVDLNLNRLPNSPTFYAIPRNKGGEWAKSEMKFYWKEDWELKS